MKSKILWVLGVFLMSRPPTRISDEDAKEDAFQKWSQTQAAQHIKYNPNDPRFLEYLKEHNLKRNFESLTDKQKKAKFKRWYYEYIS
jgi:hypothetical protein